MAVLSASANLTVMIKAIEKAEKSLVRDFSEVEKLQISVKGPGDFVSRADKRSEEIIFESLSKDRPDWGFMGEEGTNVKGRDERYRWIIDPLDGTTNFLHGIPDWCITIALEKDGDIIAGVTYDPIRGEMFRVEKGVGAFMNNSRLRVSGRKDFKQAVTCLNIGYRRNDPAALAEHSKIWMDASLAGISLRAGGGLALEMCYVAAGRYDAAMCWQAKPWDVAAGLLMIREAKGVVTDLTLKPATVDSAGFMMGNPDLHKAFADLAGLKS